MAQTKTSPVQVEGSTGTKEHTIGIMPEIYRGKGFGGKEQYNVIVSDRSITFALITPTVTGPAAKIYSGKSTASIVAENKKNFSIERETMKSFNFKPGHSYADCCGKLQEIDGELGIVTPKNKYSFSVPFRRTDIAKDVLERAGLYSPDASKPDSEAGQAAGSCCGH